MADGFARVPGVLCAQLAGISVGEKDPVLQILGTCAVIADCCFSLGGAKRPTATVAVPPSG